ncbi:MAG: hypothetical protein KJ906_02395 [Nanoarchaeota archaeon]|nr:hypothetical protein [Nanoarchaeota archaeon]
MLSEGSESSRIERKIKTYSEDAVNYFQRLLKEPNRFSEPYYSKENVREFVKRAVSIFDDEEIDADDQKEIEQNVMSSLIKQGILKKETVYRFNRK